MNQLYAELGRCLYIFQLIELRLKFLLPFMAATKSDGSAAGPEDWRASLDSKTTLGPLIQRLKDRVQLRERDQLEADWTLLVNYRNEVVHQFVTQPFSQLQSQEDHALALGFLRQCSRHAVQLLKMLQDLVGAFGLALDLVEDSGASTLPTARGES